MIPWIRIRSCSWAGCKPLAAVFFCAVLMLLFPGSALGAVWYVAGDAPASGDGSNWSKAFKTIQQAVDASDPTNGDEIWVKHGTYILAEPISPSAAVQVYGGFAGWEVQREQRNWLVNETSIDGNDAVRCFVFQYLGDISLLDGLTIRNGKATGDGGGVLTTSGLTISNCTLLQNKATGYGGAINGSVSMDACTFLQNTAGSGGGAVSGLSLAVTNCTFAGNTTSAGSGGALYSWNGSNIKITNSVFLANSAASYGGAMFHNVPAMGGLYAPVFTNCTFLGNSASIGGALRFTGTGEMLCSARIVNTISWGNTAPTLPEISASGVKLLATYSNIKGGVAGEGNIDSDPLFSDSSGRLSYGSPCVDAGNNSATYIKPTDIAGRVRVIDGNADGTPVVDMGAYEYGLSLTSPKGGELWWEEEKRNITWIGYESEVGALVKIEITRDSGQTWTTLVSNAQNLGYFKWEVSPPASYACRIRVSSVDYPSVMGSSDADFGIETDIDNDGMGDLWEIIYFGNLDRDGTKDRDGDGLSDKGEFERGTDPTDRDTDKDGMPDGWEVEHGLNPLSEDGFEDADGDGNCNLREYLGNSDPQNPENLPSSTILHVDVGNISGIEDGTQERPFSSIQKGVSCASATVVDEIWVRNGTYPLSTTIVIEKNLEIYGGFNGTETSRGQRNWKENVTTVDGQGTVRCFTVRNSNVTIDGFSIINGRSGEGGAVYCYRITLTLRNCRFSNNKAVGDTGGGAIKHAVGTIMVTDSVFEDNRAEDTWNDTGGGAVYSNGRNSYVVAHYLRSTFINNVSDNRGGAILNEGVSGSIIDCLFYQNRSPNDGGAVANRSSSPFIINCIFVENSSRGGGAIVNADYNAISSPSLPMIINCLFAGNTASYSGGAIWNSTLATGSSGESLAILNSTFHGNASSEGGGAIFNSKASPRITNCIFWGGSTAGAPSEIENGSGAAPAVTYCNVQGGYPGAGNINANPLFQNASAGNFRLQPGSPCIDRGTNDALLILEYDLEGNPRFFDGNNDGNAIVDMGAYEYRPAGFGAGDVNDDGTVTLADAIVTLRILSGMQPLTPPPRTSEVNYDGKIGLEEALFILQTISGLRP